MNKNSRPCYYQGNAKFYSILIHNFVGVITSCNDSDGATNVIFEMVD